MTSSTHAYVKISEELRSRIISGQLGPGDRFPTERELVDEFDVARMTVRRALEMLEEEELIDRKRGRTGGTFVRTVPPVVWLGTGTDFEGQLRSQGHDTNIRPVSIDRCAAPHHVASKLGIERGQQVWLVRRLRVYDGVVASLVHHHLPVDIYPDLSDKELTGPFNEADTLSLHCEAITPVLPGDIHQDLLGVTKSHPLLKVSRILEGHHGRPVDFVEEFINPDLLSVEIRVS